MRKYTMLLALLLTMLRSAAVFSQALPHTINYQGVLKDASGVVISNGDYNLKFTIYEGDVAIWTETKSIAVTDGIFNTQLGSVTPIDLPFDAEYYLGITIGTESELSPRVKLSSVPYSYMSMNVPDGSITASKIYNGSITAQKLNDMGATNGQVLKWNGTTWNPAGDETGTDGLTLPFSGTTFTNVLGSSAFKIANSGTNQINAIYGHTTTTDNVMSMGVVGRSDSYDGRGVYGWATHKTGITFGVQGIAESTTGWGVWGSATSTTGTTYGVYGISASSSGTGVYGRSSSTSGIGVSGEGKTALYGETDAELGYGLHIKCTHASGVTRGVNSSVSSPNGFSGYFAGGKFTVTSSKVGIGTVVPNYQLDIAGVTNLNRGVASGIALRCNGDEALWYNGTYFSWGYSGVYNFFGNKLRIGGNGNLEPAYTLYVDGTAAKSSSGTAWIISSDIRLKDILGNYERGLADITELQPVVFKYKDNNSRNLPSKTEEIGFVAQDVQKVFPEAVTKAGDGYLDFNIHPINVALVNAVKELKAENDELKARLEKIEKYLNTTSMR